MSADLGDLPNIKFPHCVTKGLQKLEELLRLPPSLQVHDAQQCVIDDYIFYFRETQNLGPIDELQICRSIFHHVSQIFDPAARNMFFMTLFPVIGNEQRTNFKIRLLAPLVSLAVVTHNISVLEATSVWMQQVGCLSSRCGQICHTLLNDYFLRKDSTKPHFQRAIEALPKGTPLFAANAITSLSQIFAKLGTTEFCDPPPDFLVEVIINWLTAVPGVILEPLNTPVPGISLPMVPVLAVGPLSKWCVEAPFLFEDKQRCQRFSELHLFLLQTMQTVSFSNPPLPKLDVVCAEHFTNIIDVLRLRLNDSNYKTETKELSLNRLAQIILVALHTNCITGRTFEMWASLRRLPCMTRTIEDLLKMHATK